MDASADLARNSKAGVLLTPSVTVGPELEGMAGFSVGGTDETIETLAGSDYLGKDGRFTGSLGLCDGGVCAGAQGTADLDGNVHGIQYAVGFGGGGEFALQVASASDWIVYHDGFNADGSESRNSRLQIPFGDKIRNLIKNPFLFKMAE